MTLLITVNKNMQIMSNLLMLYAKSLEIKLCHNDFRINYQYFPSLKHSLLLLQIKMLALSLFRQCVGHWIKSTCASLLIKTLCLSKTQASLLGFLITFVDNSHFNLVVMFVHFVNQSSVVNLIYLKKLILL